jgi:peptidoglycan/LPS O-acetylase OafA/YrhL
MSKKGRRQQAASSDTAASAKKRGAPVRARSTELWPALTGLRGFAALSVLLLHAYLLGGTPASVPAPLAWILANGWSGVDIFFTLSAFLLTVPFVRAQAGLAAEPSLQIYARHRLLRILPAYYVQLIILLALGLLGAETAMAWRSTTLGNVLANVFFLYNALPGIHAAVPPWWTLPVELGFYLFLPLFAKCLRPGRWWWLMIGIAASLAFRFWVMNAGLARSVEVGWADHLPGRLYQFLIGMLAAYAFVHGEIRGGLPRGRMADALALAALLVFLLLPMLGYLSSDHAFSGAPERDPLLLCWHLYASVIVAVLLIALAAGAPLVGRVFASQAMRGLGLVSYSLYLWHYPVMLAVRESLGGYQAVRADFLPFFFYSLLFSLVVAGASWWLVERPAQQWGRQAKLAT